MQACTVRTQYIIYLKEYFTENDTVAVTLNSIRKSYYNKVKLKRTKDSTCK